ncbi:MAG: sel1 repeat family protein [Nitrospinae bacterium]|nr:sel1 repeat family protein [Nitrospinota bacterium]
MEALCGEGNSTACFRVGERYRTVERDNKKALEYYIKACDSDYMTGCTNGGILLALKGTPYSKDFKQARKMFDKACEAGEDQSCFNLGTLNYKEGRQKKAIKYYKKACGMGNQGGCAKEKRLRR